jgi:hypothetical protein
MPTFAYQYNAINMSNEVSKRYAQRGVSASKEDVHNAIKNIDKGLFPKAFCKIVPDYLTNDEDYCLIMHADGAGTKSSLAYMYWKETGDISVWKGIAQDALIMNIDDLLCVGAADNIMLSSTIGRNKNLIPGEVISAIINGTEELIKDLKSFGVTIHSTGGETADVGDLVRTIIVDSTVTARSDGLVTYKFIPSDSSNIGFKTPAHEASVAIINDNTMYFSGGTVNRKNKIDYNKRGVSNLKLQKAMLKDHKWVLDVEGTKQLDFLNLENYSVGNPAFSPDNKRLFFVSCAPYPDAKGQSDIYYTDIMVDGSFGPVKNVPGINTGGRESFPFVSSDGTLYFSSDGFYNYELGLGLLDIYKVENINKVIQIAEEASNNNQQIEIVVEHLEAPFNSPKDDFAFFIEKPNGINSVAYAYFSSNREHPEAQCDDDIYRVRLSVSKSAEQK